MYGCLKDEGSRQKYGKYVCSEEFICVHIIHHRCIIDYNYKTAGTMARSLLVEDLLGVLLGLLAGVGVAEIRLRNRVNVARAQERNQASPCGPA